MNHAHARTRTVHGKEFAVSVSGIIAKKARCQPAIFPLKPKKHMTGRLVISSKIGRNIRGNNFMKFVIENPCAGAAQFFRRAGYTFQKREGDEMAFVRRLTDQPFPRFHLFVIIVGFQFHVNFHIDHKAASYEGQNMHSGEYDSDSKILKEEAERIKSIS